MGYLIEIDDLRKHIVYPPAYPYPWDGAGDEPEVLAETAKSAGIEPEQPTAAAIQEAKHVSAKILEDQPPSGVQQELNLSMRPAAHEEPSEGQRHPAAPGSAAVPAAGW